MSQGRPRGLVTATCRCPFCFWDSDYWTKVGTRVGRYPVCFGCDGAYRGPMCTGAAMSDADQFEIPQNAHFRGIAGRTHDLRRVNPDCNTCLVRYCLRISYRSDVGSQSTRCLYIYPDTLPFLQSTLGSMTGMATARRYPNQSRSFPSKSIIKTDTCQIRRGVMLIIGSRNDQPRLKRRYRPKFGQAAPQPVPSCLDRKLIVMSITKGSVQKSPSYLFGSHQAETANYISEYSRPTTRLPRPWDNHVRQRNKAVGKQGRVCTG
jgi:hypothetical protein